VEPPPPLLLSIGDVCQFYPYVRRLVFYQLPCFRVPVSCCIRGGVYTEGVVGGPASFCVFVGHGLSFALPEFQRVIPPFAHLCLP